MRHLHWTRGRNRSFGFNSRSSFKRHQCKKTVGSPSNIQNWKDLIFLFLGEGWVWSVERHALFLRGMSLTVSHGGCLDGVKHWDFLYVSVIRMIQPDLCLDFLVVLPMGFPCFFMSQLWQQVQRSHVIRSAGLQTGTNDFRTRATCVGWRPVSVNPCRAGSGNPGWCISPRFVQVYPNSAHFSNYQQLHL